MKTTKLSTLAAAALLALVPVLSLKAEGGAPDLDGDGIPNIVDPDIDADGIPNAQDRNVDGGIARSGPFSGRYIGDHLDNDSPAEPDIDSDGQDDDSMADRDIDGDGEADDSALETDMDGDQRADDSAAERDTDGDAKNDDDDSEVDIDGDGFDDDDDSEMDIDGDNAGDDTDDDIDGDDRNNSSAAELDTDGDGKPDSDPAEDDDDGDGTKDRDDDDDDNDGDDDSDDGDHHDEDDEVEVQVTLHRDAAPSGSRSRVKIQKMATGKVELEVDGRDFPAGAYDVTVDGTVIGQLHIIADGDKLEGEQEWETGANKPSEINLTTDVIGKPITVSQNGVIYFSGTVPTPPPPGDPGGGDDNGGDGSGSVELNLARTAAAPADAKAKVDLEFGVAGLKKLEFEAEDIAAGDYEFLTGDTVRATFTATVGETSHLVITAEPEDDGDVLLDFPAAGEVVSIRQGGTVFFSGTLPLSP